MSQKKRKRLFQMSNKELLAWRWNYLRRHWGFWFDPAILKDKQRFDRIRPTGKPYSDYGWI